MSKSSSKGIGSAACVAGVELSSDDLCRRAAGKMMMDSISRLVAMESSIFHTRFLANRFIYNPALYFLYSSHNFARRSGSVSAAAASRSCWATMSSPWGLGMSSGTGGVAPPMVGFCYARSPSGILPRSATSGKSRLEPFSLVVLIQGIPTPALVLSHPAPQRRVHFPRMSAAVCCPVRRFVHQGSCLRIWR